jgi:hypothetical protein
LRRPQFSWVPALRKSFLLLHATVAWRTSFFSFSGGDSRPASGRYGASSVLRPASLRRLHYGYLDATPRTASFLDPAQSSLY